MPRFTGANMRHQISVSGYCNKETHQNFVLLTPCMGEVDSVPPVALQNGQSVSWLFLYTIMSVLTIAQRGLYLLNGKAVTPLQWSHNECNGVSNHRRLNFRPSRVFLRRSKRISRLRVTGLCEGNPSVTGGFPSERASNGESDSLWWRHHAASDFHMVWQPLMQLRWQPYRLV